MHQARSEPARSAYKAIYIDWWVNGQQEKLQ